LRDSSAGPGTSGQQGASGDGQRGSGADAQWRAQGADADRGGERGAGAEQGAPANGSVPSDASWTAILDQLDLQGSPRQLASHCVLLGRQGSLVRLALDPRVKFVRTSTQEEKLAQALSRFYGETVRLEFTMATGDVETPAQAEQRVSQQELEAARQSFESDPGVQGLRERFGATLLPNTVRPAK
jgi:DNA polymerase-3 subunit gamma/tau